MLNTFFVQNWRFKTKRGYCINLSIFFTINFINNHSSSLFWYILHFRIPLPLTRSHDFGRLNSTFTQTFLTSSSTFLMSSSELKLEKRFEIEDSLLKASFKIPVLIFTFFKAFSWSIMIGLRGDTTITMPFSSDCNRNPGKSRNKQDFT